MSAGAPPSRPARRRYHAPCPACSASPDKRTRTRETREDGTPEAVVACGACGHELGRWSVSR